MSIVASPENDKMLRGGEGMTWLQIRSRKESSQDWACVGEGRRMRRVREK